MGLKWTQKNWKYDQGQISCNKVHDAFIDPGKSTRLPILIYNLWAEQETTFIWSSEASAPLPLSLSFFSVNLGFCQVQEMEDPYSVSSPRRILSLSRKRRATVSSLDADERTSGFGVSGEHGPKPSEVYGFVGSITTVIATGPIHWLCFYFILDMI